MTSSVNTPNNLSGLYQDTDSKGLPKKVLVKKPAKKPAPKPKKKTKK